MIKLIIALAITFTFSCKALALTLSPASITTGVHIRSFSFGTPDFFSQVRNGSTSVNNSFSLGGASGTVDANAQPLPHMTATASASPGGQLAEAEATFIYYFGVSGPAGVDVPVIINASGGVSLGAGLSQAAIVLATPSGLLTIANASNSSNCFCDGPSFSVARLVTISSETQYELTMSLIITADTFLDPSVSDANSGVIDPIILIDPTFPLANQFTLEFSAGVGNGATATPIPAALQLFATGLGLIGLLGWRRKPLA
jgi:hypothetical protein